MRLMELNEYNEYAQFFTDALNNEGYFAPITEWETLHFKTEDPLFSGNTLNLANSTFEIFVLVGGSWVSAGVNNITSWGNFAHSHAGAGSKWWLAMWGENPQVGNASFMILTALAQAVFNACEVRYEFYLEVNITGANKRLYSPHYTLSYDKAEIVVVQANDWLSRPQLPNTVIPPNSSEGSGVESCSGYYTTVDGAFEGTFDLQYPNVLDVDATNLYRGFYPRVVFTGKIKAIADKITHIYLDNGVCTKTGSDRVKRISVLGFEYMDAYWMGEVLSILEAGAITAYKILPLPSQPVYYRGTQEENFAYSEVECYEGGKVSLVLEACPCRSRIFCP